MFATTTTSNESRIHLIVACGAGVVLAIIIACSRGGSTRSERTEGMTPGSPGASTIASTSGSETASSLPPERLAQLDRDGSGKGGTVSEPSMSVAPPTPEEAKAAWREGVALYEKGDYEAGSKRLQIAAAGRSEDPYTHYLLGLSLWKSGESARAAEALERSAALDGQSVRTWTNLARVRLDQKDSQHALDAAEQALALDPSSASALHQKGRALAEMGKSDEALVTLDQAFGSDRDNGYIANTIGYILLSSGRAADAIPYLEAARDRLPQVAYVRNNLGVAYERTGQLDKSMDEYRAAVEAGDSGGKSAASLARLETFTGRTLAKGTVRPPKEGTPVAQTVEGDGSTNETSGTPH